MKFSINIAWIVGAILALYQANIMWGNHGYLFTMGLLISTIDLKIGYTARNV